MRRLGRSLLLALAALSLVVCVVVVAAWVRSYWVADTYWWHGAGWDTFVLNTRGSMTVTATRVATPRTSSPTGYVPMAPWTATPSVTGRSSDPGIRSVRSLPGLSWLISDGGVGPPPAAAPLGLPPGMVWGPTTYRARRYVFVRHWLAALVFGALPAWYLAGRLIRARRPPAGHCQACTYDLTGNVSGVCPECGTTVTAAPPATALP